jgi:CBS domain-containing protein
MKELLIESIMRRGVVATTPTEMLAATRAAMEREGVHQLPVIENDMLVGILSERDLHAHTGYLERTKVDAAMTWNPVTVRPTETAQHAAHLLIEKSINALPVVEGGRLVGIVSRTDLLQLLERLLAEPPAQGPTPKV